MPLPFPSSLRLALGLLVALGLAACRPPQDGDGGKGVAPGASAVVLVETARPERASLRDRLEVTGRIEAFRRAEVVTRVEGVIVAVEKVEGDAVRKGDVLARIESDQQALALRMKEIAERQAGLALRQAELAIDEARARLAAKAVTLEQARRDLERARGQHEARIISDQDLDAAATAAEAAAAEHDQAVLAVRRAEEDRGREELVLEDARAQVEKARLELSWTAITATLDGRVTERRLRLGQRAAPGETAYVVEDLESLVLEAALPEKELRAVRTGLEVELSSPARPGVALRGVVEHVADRIDDERGSVGARIRLMPSDPPALPGMFVAGHVVTEVREDVLTLPKKALKFDRDRVHVYVIDRSDPETVRVRRVAIRRGLENAERVEFLPEDDGAPAPGPEDEIVVVGLDRLFDGAPVRLREDAAPPADGTGG